MDRNVMTTAIITLIKYFLSASNSLFVGILISVFHKVVIKMIPVAASYVNEMSVATSYGQRGSRNRFELYCYYRSINNLSLFTKYTLVVFGMAPWYSLMS